MLITDRFLLHGKAAYNLYHGYAAHLPLIDYHNHLPPEQIAADYRFGNLTEIWLKGDHYKWRALRAWGIPEHFITGAATDAEKFTKWAEVSPQTLRNPLFHWTQMELQNPFGINEYLNTETGPGIYEQCNGLLQTEAFSVKNLLRGFKAEMLGTTDDPCDTLEHHAALAAEGFEIKVLPGFRPDKVFNIAQPDAFFSYLNRLQECSGQNITDLDGLISALHSRVNYFHSHGCRVSDHGFNALPLSYERSTALEIEFKKFIAEGGKLTFSNPDAFAGYVLAELCRMYQAKNWVQQFHLGAIRNNNSRLVRLIGSDVGADSIADVSNAQALSTLLNTLDSEDKLAKTVIYNLNPADNEVFATMAGNFNQGPVRGKVQFGAAWWFLDQKDGMEKQLNALSSLGLISTFLGMLTDSRSFLSFSRHAYFRRILCNLFGTEMEKGELPNDEQWVGRIIQDICYYNAKNYFNNFQ